jgi:predicted nucleic-acid-binding protein
MIGIDSNVLVRYLVADDALQARTAARFIENQLSPDSPGFISAVTLAETMWVLREAYGYEKSVVADVVARLLATRQLVLEHAAAVQRALADASESGIELADALIGQIGLAAGCDATVTFDRKAARSGAFRPLP